MGRIYYVLLALIVAAGVDAQSFMPSWRRNPEEERVEYYNTYRNDSLIYSGIDTFCLDTGVEFGREYCYRVVAVNASGVSEPSLPVCGLWVSWNDSVNSNNDNVVIYDGVGRTIVISPPPGNYEVEINSDEVRVITGFDVDGDGRVTLSDFAGVVADSGCVPESFVKLFGDTAIWRGGN